jgi:hypothetical protein
VLASSAFVKMNMFILRYPKESCIMSVTLCIRNGPNIASKARKSSHELGPFLEAGIPHGIHQLEISLRAGRAYTGRVVLAGAPGTKVDVSLIGGRILPIARR